jgi:hypothetical protein
VAGEDDQGGAVVALAAGRWAPPRMAAACTLKGWPCRGC